MARATRTRESSHQDDRSGEAVAAQGLDVLLGELESVVAELERGDLTLEATLARFEAGVRLARDAGLRLDAVEQRVAVLMADHDPEGTPVDTAERDDDV